MVSLLIAMFAATIVLAWIDGVVPGRGETVVSELAHAVFTHSSVLYAFVQTATALVLLLAANTAFSDFPRLLFFLARDDHAPHSFLRMGDRLAFSNGILLLAGAAGLLYAAFDGRTERLIPLFAVGVFLAFRLSQSGMVVHWWRGRAAGWKRSIVFNLLGAVLPAVVLAVTATTKFTEGAWVVVLLVPLLVWVFVTIRRHYRQVLRATRLHPLAVARPRRGSRPSAAPARANHAAVGDPEADESPAELAHLIVVPVQLLDLPTVRTLAYAASLSQPVLVLHLAPNDEEADRFRAQWRAWGDHLPLEIVNSPYRALVAPIARYLQALHSQRPSLTVTALLPELIVHHFWQRLLHNQIPARLRRALRPHHGIVVTTVPFHLPET